MLSIASCSVSTNPITSSYNYANPAETIILPDTLREVSGVAILDSTTVSFIQDENGILFTYSLREKRITKQQEFAIDGDYEEITRVGKSVYILRSDGTLFEIADYENAASDVDTFNTGIPAVDNEGLCYDKANNRLLIACKSKLDKSAGDKDSRAIYGFDLTTKTLSSTPVYNFDLKEIKKFAEDNKVDIPQSKKKGKNGGADIKFKTSAIDIHPITKKLYLLSAADHLLFIFNLDGTLENIEVLDKDRYNKAEGLAFFANGDMLITNEAQNKKPTLLRLNYNKP
ncbi:MAG: hypothetical protein M0D57_18135 [Sphingobacteriales bacterium JAD_PAG50586_3]|nr:MAG: hypothetical protein M0D57_18135 [Sphingobacteriales bacterium JAD_PAG50586_3]